MASSPCCPAVGRSPPPPLPSAAMHATASKLRSLAMDSVVPSEPDMSDLRIEVTTIEPSGDHDDRWTSFEDLIATSPPAAQLLLDSPHSSSYTRIHSNSHSHSDSSPLMPASPTLHTRRLPSRVSRRLKRAREETPHSPDEQQPSADKAIFTPNSLASSYSSNTSTSGGSPESGCSSGEWSWLRPGSAVSVQPFFPVVPHLHSTDDMTHAASGTPVAPVEQMAPAASNEEDGGMRFHVPTSGAHHASLALTRSHLLQLASTSFGFLSSCPSSATSSCPASPEGTQRSFFYPSSPSSSSLDRSVECHTPDSPSWRARAAHQSSMELSARRRAHEAFQGRESVSRMRFKGLSSRAQQAACSSSGGSDYADYSGISDCDTPSPSNTPGPPTNGATLTRTRSRTHRVMPLMSSQGHIDVQAMTPTSFDAATDSFLSPVSSSISSLTPTSLHRVDPDFLERYLGSLSSSELHAIVHPIEALLTVSPSHSSALTAAPAPFSLAAVHTLSPLQLTVILSRCVARSRWRKSVPCELLHHALGFLDLASLLTRATRISRHWRDAVRDMVDSSHECQAEIAHTHAEQRRRQKMRVYRRLTREDTEQMQIMQAAVQLDDRETNAMDERE